ncbi:MAG: WecB/TagA/CpsF family glycosyltransferase [Candidatus Magasanikbacteria bacterium]|nr:WecB/TagA/CpsF family glycosyltransferase [Candidatus Magasanikbacteria bacterium]
MEILGVRIDESTSETALARVADFFSNKSLHTVFTPNPEMLVDASNDRYFRDVLNSGTLNICDGKGIEIVSKCELKRIPGTDFMLEICRLAEKMGKSIFLLGSGSKKNIDEAGINLKKEFPNLRISGVHPGIDIKLEGERIVYNSEDNDFLLDSIIEASPDVLFVGFGHGKQEKWIYENQKHLPSVRLAMGVGGAFDFLSGKIRRAPRLFRYFGLEWLWRLLVQPWRIGRIWKATVKFLYLYIFQKLV